MTFICVSTRYGVLYLGCPERAPFAISQQGGDFLRVELRARNDCQNPDTKPHKLFEPLLSSSSLVDVTRPSSVNMASLQTLTSRDLDSRVGEDAMFRV